MEQYVTYESRLASFQKTYKKRASTAGGRGKTLSWPHKQIAPASLARAGFYFEPYIENPDNCACFLCGKGMDGWEEGDDPLQEHLKHSPTCGWAIYAAIEADIEEYTQEDPSLPHMVEGRKATFAGKWPHEGRKGWKCKTKQLVEAGWVYTPTEESDDMATCAYCQLGLDGWEPSDKPYDEHYSRSPNCSFFALLKQFGGVNKKGTREKAARGSKASRLSTQSVATAASEIASVADTTAETEDSILTTTSVLSRGVKKPVGRKKKAATKKIGSKTSKKSQVDEEREEIDPEDEQGRDNESDGELPLQPKPTRAARGKKRTSDAVEDSVVFLSEAPASKRRAAASNDTFQMDSSAVSPEDNRSIINPKATGRTRGGSSAKSSLKSSASLASLRAAPEYFADDDEIDRQLEADLDRFTTDDEITHDSESERRAREYKSNKTKSIASKSQDYTMLNPEEVEVDDEALDEDLRQLQAEMEISEPQQEVQVPKKGRKAGTTRKVSKQTKATGAKVPMKAKGKTKAPSPSPSSSPSPSPSLSASLSSSPPPDLDLEPKPEVEPEAEPESEPESEMAQSLTDEEQDQSPIGNASVATKTRETTPSPPAKKPRGRPAKSSVSNTSNLADGRAQKGPGRPPKVPVARSSPPLDSPAPVSEQLDELESEIDEQGEEVDLGTTPDHRRSPSAAARHSTSPAPRVSRSRLSAEPPSTPAHTISPAPSARQPVLSPSPSPQSSDAENQPPSSVLASTNTGRVVLAPIVTTPVHNSPTRRNVLGAGLQSHNPWTAIDLDAVTATPGLRMTDKENVISSLLRQGPELTSPEREMTVEEWIQFNAEEAEKKLKNECEALVMRFEREGTRAMNVLEGLPVE
ncbi:hypothetical protein E4U57_000606 [Claviceps arundinis]|uniref:Chromosome segregation protein BIR1 n=1 Tax=Claviceps arundinis TaxID=1623583 RepID=A0ABQ7PCD9_9HYPO|nr:hypothetical protein E4U57_000606 [Claviceps arundinis]